MTYLEDRTHGRARRHIVVHAVLSLIRELTGQRHRARPVMSGRGKSGDIKIDWR